MADEAEKKDGEEEVPKKSSKMIIIIALNVLLLGGGGAFFVLSSGGDAEEEGGDDKEDDDDDKKKKKKKKKKKGSDLNTGNGAGPLLDLDGFVVNITGEDSKTRYLKTKLSIELDSPEDVDGFNKVLMIVRNEILMNLSALDMTGIVKTNQKKKIESDLVDAINERLGEDVVVGVYFTEFVTQ